MEPVRDPAEGMLASRRQATAILLDSAVAQIEWRLPPADDALARLLLQLVGETSLEELFDD